MATPWKRYRDWENGSYGGLMLSGCLGTFVGIAILVWALIDLHGLLDTRRGWFALIAAPIAIVIGIRRIRRAKDAP